jgi:predicted phosphoribosyltransferase
VIVVRKLGVPFQHELGMGARVEARERAEVEARAALEIVPGATQLFEEPGALETVAALAAGWFTRHFTPLENHHPE